MIPGAFLAISNESEPSSGDGGSRDDDGGDNDDELITIINKWQAAKRETALRPLLLPSEKVNGRIFFIL